MAEPWFTTRLAKVITYHVAKLNSNDQKVDNKNYVCKFSKNVKSKLYDIENSKTRWQTVWIYMSWLIMSHLIKIYAVCKFRYFRIWYLRRHAHLQNEEALTSSARARLLLVGTRPILCLKSKKQYIQ